MRPAQSVSGAIELRRSLAPPCSLLWQFLAGLGNRSELAQHVAQRRRRRGHPRVAREVGDPVVELRGLVALALLLLGALPPGSQQRADVLDLGGVELGRARGVREPVPRVIQAEQHRRRRLQPPQLRRLPQERLVGVLRRRESMLLRRDGVVRPHPFLRPQRRLLLRLPSRSPSLGCRAGVRLAAAVRVPGALRLLPQFCQGLLHRAERRRVGQARTGVAARLQQPVARGAQLLPVQPEQLFEGVPVHAGKEGGKRKLRDRGAG